MASVPNLCILFTFLATQLIRDLYTCLAFANNEGTDKGADQPMLSPSLISIS